MPELPVGEYLVDDFLSVRRPVVSAHCCDVQYHSCYSNVGSSWRINLDRVLNVLVVHVLQKSSSTTTLADTPLGSFCTWENGSSNITGVWRFTHFKFLGWADLADEDVAVKFLFRVQVHYSKHHQWYYHRDLVLQGPVRSRSWALLGSNCRPDRSQKASEIKDRRPGPQKTAKNRSKPVVTGSVINTLKWGIYRQNPGLAYKNIL